MQVEPESRPQLIVETTNPRSTLHGDTVPACGTCAIVLKPVARFGRLEDPVLLRDIPVVERDGSGGYYATVVGHDDHEVIHYGPTGEVVGTIGSYGSGPGEFRTVWDIRLGSGDSLLVVHDNSISLFAPGGKAVHTVAFTPPISAFPDIVAFSEGSVVLAEQHLGNGPDTLNLPLHEYLRSGAFHRAFGPRGIMGEYMTKHGLMVGKRRAAWAGVTFWLMEEVGYRFANVDMDGRILRQIAIRPPREWQLYMATVTTVSELEDSLGTDPRSRASRRPSRAATEPLPTVLRPARKPPTIVSDMAVLNDTLLMVVIHTAATDWQNVSVPLDTTRLTEGGSPVHAVPGYRQRLTDTILDIVHIESGLLTVRSRLEGAFHSMGDGMLYRVSVDRVGVVGVETFALELRGPVPDA